jgi:hypothetical protein
VIKKESFPLLVPCSLVFSLGIILYSTLLFFLLVVIPHPQVPFPSYLYIERLFNSYLLSFEQRGSEILLSGGVVFSLASRQAEARN